MRPLAFDLHAQRGRLLLDPALPFPRVALFQFGVDLVEVFAQSTGDWRSIAPVARARVMV